MELSRRDLAALMLGGAAALGLAGRANAESDPLPSWSAGPAKDAIVEFVRATTDPASPNFVPLAQRVATFDQDGTLWVEHPIYTQLVFCFDRLPAVVKAKPELAKVEPFRTALTGNGEAIGRLGLEALVKIVAATLTGMDVDSYRDEVAKWIAEARDPRWKRPYTELVYQPQIELLNHLRSVGYRTYIVTGGGQDFVRVYAEQVYGIPPEQVVGTAGAVSYQYGAKGPVLIKEPKLLLNDDNAGKPEGIHLMIGPPSPSAIRPATGRCSNIRRPAAAPGSRCWCCMTTSSANTPTDRLRACPTPR
jgi:phosphoglycolate phosphatase-like HAD superfamily hydrolase